MASCDDEGFVAGVLQFYVYETEDNRITSSITYANAGKYVLQVLFPEDNARSDEKCLDMAGRLSNLAPIMEEIVRGNEDFTLDCYLYTDGVTEAHDENEEMFGEERLLKALNENPDLSAEELDEHVRSKVAEFVGDTEQYDDITTLCFRYLGL